MKKTHLAILTATLLLAACGHKENDTVSLNGNIQGLGNDTIYLYGTDRFYNRMDTLVASNGKFSGQIKIDTLVAAWLQFGNGTEYPLYMDKADKIEISGSADQLEQLNIKGNRANEELTSFHQEWSRQPNATEADKEKAAESFIKSHPSSLASIYLLEKYFVQKSSPDFKKIAYLTEQMAGNLKDRLYMEQLTEYIEAREKATVGKTAPYFQLPDEEGKDIRRTDFKDKYLLLYFWASWDEACRESNEFLRKVYKDKKTRQKFDILGISLDLDKKQWKEAIRKDTLEWRQACDFKGWNSNVVSQFAVRSLPSNLLLSPSGRIEGRNLTQTEIEKKLIEIASKK